MSPGELDIRIGRAIANLQRCVTIARHGTSRSEIGGIVAASVADDLSSEINKLTALAIQLRNEAGAL